MIVAAAVIPSLEPAEPLEPSELLDSPVSPEALESADVDGQWREASVTALVDALESVAAAGEPASEVLIVAAVPVRGGRPGAPVGLQTAHEVLDAAVEAGALNPQVTRVERVAIATDATAEEASTLGLVAASFTAGASTGQDTPEERTVLLVVADGSAPHSDTGAAALDLGAVALDVGAAGSVGAPVGGGDSAGPASAGPDPRAADYDRAWRTALAEGDAGALAALDPGLAAEVHATGRAPLQVLAAATDDAKVTARIHATGEPRGVTRCAATWTCA